MSRETGRRFHFLREIASGGFGAVYLTKVMHADGFSRLAAVKLLHRRWTENEEIARRMRDEARLLGWLRHRNIVDVVDLTSIDGRAAVVMEYLEAVDLKFIIGQMVIRNGQVPARVVLEVMSSVASALDAAYNRPPYAGERPLRVIHRDIKPSNIMIDESGLVKVLDFGVARAEFDARESQTKELQFGSVDYMPPERLFFEPETPASDVYSLGATIYEVLTLEKLGKAKGRPERHARFLADRFSYMRAAIGLGGAEATEVERLLTGCLAFDHKNRPPAGEVHTLARDVARQLPGLRITEWGEEHVGGLVRLMEEQPRTPSPLTDSVLAEDSRAFGISQGEVKLTMADGLQEGMVTEEMQDPDDLGSEEPVPERPPWMFEETYEESPSEAQAIREALADQAGELEEDDLDGPEVQVDVEDDLDGPEEEDVGGEPAVSCPSCNHRNPGSAHFCEECGTSLPSLVEVEVEETQEEQNPGSEGDPGDEFAASVEVEDDEDDESEGPIVEVEDDEDDESDLPSEDLEPSAEDPEAGGGIRSHPTIIPELADLPPVPATAVPFDDEIDPDLMETRVMPRNEEPTLLRPSEDADLEDSFTAEAGYEEDPLRAMAPVVDPIPGMEPSLDDWDDIPTRIEAEAETVQSGAARVGGSSVVSVVEDDEPADDAELPGDSESADDSEPRGFEPVEGFEPIEDGDAATMLMSTPAPDMEPGDDATQLLPEDELAVLVDPATAPPPGGESLPPLGSPASTGLPPPAAPPPPPPGALGGDATTAMPVSTRPPPEFDPAFGEIPATAPPPKKKSRLPLFVGGCFGLMLVFGCCGGLAGTGLFGTLMAPDMEDQGVSLPEAPELDPIEVPEIDPTLPDDPGQAGVPELPPGVPDRPEVDLAPDVPPPVSGGMTFQSLAEGTRKVKVSCGGGKASEEGSSVVLELSGDPKCTVTAYLDDRSRITAIVMDASEGNYRCFEGGEQRCER